MKNHLRLLPGTLALLVTWNSVSYAAAATEADSVPLMNSLERFHGDKATWSFENGVLRGKAGAQDQRAGRIFTVERFGNFVLQFQARADSRGGSVFVRSAMHPIDFLGGYEFRLGPPGGGLSFHDLPNFQRMAEAHAKGVPYNNAAMLLAWDSPARGDGEWVDYELACLGDRLTLKRNGATIVHYRHTGGPLEGSIGFGLDAAGSADLRNLRVRLLGSVHWPARSPAGDLTGRSADDWTAEDPPFGRILEEEWTDETNKLLREARNPREFRPLFEEGGSGQWKESKSFWSIEDGVIRGESLNSFLVTTRDYSDFILRAQVRLNPKIANSGIQVRSRLTESGMAGYQIDMAVHDTGQGMLPWWGQIYGEELNRGFLYGIDDPAKRLDLVRHGAWNDVVIICKGNHVIVELNGEVTADLVDYFGDKTGKIGFQVHFGPRMKVEFRDVLIREL